MAVWLLYATAVGSVLGLAAMVAERGLRHQGLPVRGVWLGAMVATVCVPVVAAVSAGWRVGSSTVDPLVLVGWAALSLAMLANVRLALWTVRRNERSWRTDRVEGEGVLVSTGFGPGVVGASRPRVVLPRWVVDSAPSLRRLIVLHEREHVRAADTRLLLAGLVLAALLPWCLPVWWQLHRLRAAVETDCDARVVSATGDPRGYASALVAVAGRRTRDLLPIPALAPRPAELRQRIRLITAVPGDRSRLRGLGLLALALTLALGVAAVPLPAPGSVGVDAASPAADAPREAIIIFSVTG